MPQAKKAPAKKAAPKKAVAKKAVAKKAAKKSVAKKSVPKKAAAKKAAPTKKATVKRTVAKKAPSRRAGGASTTRRGGGAQTTEKAMAKRAVAKTAPVARRAPAPAPTEPPPRYVLAPEPEPAPPRADTVVVSFEGPGPQRRATVAFRIILAVPHLVFLYVLQIVASVVAVISWFAALFTARVPEGLASFNARVVQYGSRVYGYCLFLTDRYPSFALDDTDYPISVEVTPTRLNRLAVFFRLILLIPAQIVMGFVQFGVAIASFVIWLIVLILGRMPAPLFEAEAAALRYSARYYAYGWLLTGQYPGGLFGDKPSAGDSDAGLPVLPSRPRITQLVLSRAGKRLVILFIALGAVFGVGTMAVAVATSGDAAATSRKLDEAHDRLGSSVVGFSSDVAACAASSTDIDCLHDAASTLADEVEDFVRRVDALDFPIYADDKADQVKADGRRLAALVRGMTVATEPQAFARAAGEYARLAALFDRHYADLVDALPV
jgi:hypothetical protein